MKQLLLAGTAVLGLTASGLATRATPIDFTYTGSLVDFTVPTPDTYQIIAFGAQGGNVVVTGRGTGPGGLGAEIGGDFSLVAGENLQIAVGGVGASSILGAGGGGGGSFVVGPANAPLVIAGGGGGGGFILPPPGTPLSGGGGLTGPDGGNGGASGIGGSGGVGGNGGGAIFAGGGGGGGFFSAGANSGIVGGFGGGAFPGLAGGLSNDGARDGGFGGGGGSGDNASGGGGGYSGGGGGNHHLGAIDIGGGGGSFDAGFDQIVVADFQTGNGEVVITELVPEPASLALLGSAIIGLAVVWRRRPAGSL
jgi:hypothetical protein